MFGTYDPGASRLRYAAPYTKFCVGGGVLLIVSWMLFLFRRVVLAVPSNVFISDLVLQRAAFHLGLAGVFLSLLACIIILASVYAFGLWPDTARIRHFVRRGLCCPAYGNPLGLRDGELLPIVDCQEVSRGVYDIKVTATTKSVDDLAKMAPLISGYLQGRLWAFAITEIIPSEACNFIIFRADDVLADKSITYRSVRKMRPLSPYKLAVQYGTDIDLTTSGSMLIVGKTRGGKTTGVIALLLQVLLQGPDEFGSEVMVVDPKQAELSRFPSTRTLDEDGEARAILDGMKRFTASIKERQKVLNDLSEKTGDAVHWWDAGMHPSILFIDEYVGLRSVLPAKAAKGDDYCLETFDRLVKVIVTTGASAGCYMIISIAQASAGEGGLPTMIKSAMTTRVLFKPTLNEGSFIWDRTSLEAISRFPAGKQGDAWFSSTDGEHETVSRVHFPRMKFLVYRELGRLLKEYYGD